MSDLTVWRWLRRTLWRQHRPIRSFEQDLPPARVAGRAKIGAEPVAVERIVGSVGRAGNLRSDFFYRQGPAMMARYTRIGKAMEGGEILPPVRLYKVWYPRRSLSEYYVVDGHHRVAMARKLGQLYLDAEVVEYRVREEAGESGSLADALDRRRLRVGSGPDGAEGTQQRSDRSS